jgi:hypothetical protein
MSALPSRQAADAPSERATDAPSRRRFLGAIAATAITASAGCLDAFGADERRDDDPDERTLELTLVRRGGSLVDQFTTDLEATESERDEEAFETALDGSTYTTQYRPPFVAAAGEPAYTEHDGAYYRLGSVVVDEAETTRPVLRLFEADDDEGDDADATAAEQLPDVDATAVHVAHLAARARGNPGGAPWGLVQRGGYVYRNADRVNESELLSDDGPTHVRYRDRPYAVSITHERFYEPVYRATIEPVASSPEQMKAILRAKFVEARLSPAELSSDAREVLRDARHDGYRESHPYSEGFSSVLRAMHRRAYLDGNVERDAGVDRSDRQLLLYDGVYYDYRLRFVGG